MNPMDPIDPAPDTNPMSATAATRRTPGSPFALGLVGCGRLAEEGYVPALVAAASDIELVAVADPDPDRRALVTGRAMAVRRLPEASALVPAPPPRQFPDAASLLAARARGVLTLDGLVLATPAAAHLADARLAVASGVPVLVEKPPAADAAGAAALAALRPAPWVGFNRRFDPGARRVRAALAATGESDVELRLEICYRRRSWGAHAVRDDAVLDLGPHLVDWARWLTAGEVVAVGCPELTRERAVLDLTLDRGRARVVAVTDRPYAELIEVRDRTGRRIARHRRGGMTAAVVGRLAGAGPSSLVTSLAGELDAFVDAVRGVSASGASADLGTAADGHAAMVVVDAARASASSGGEPVALTGRVETP